MPRDLPLFSGPPRKPGLFAIFVPSFGGLGNGRRRGAINSLRRLRTSRLVEGPRRCEFLRGLTGQFSEKILPGYRISSQRKSAHALTSTLYIFGSGPSPEDALVGYELERLVEGQHDTAHVIDVLPSAPV